MSDPDPDPEFSEDELHDRLVVCWWALAQAIVYPEEWDSRTRPHRPHRRRERNESLLTHDIDGETHKLAV